MPVTDEMVEAVLLATVQEYGSRREQMRAALTAVYPAIRAEVLREAAGVAETAERRHSEMYRTAPRRAGRSLIAGKARSAMEIRLAILALAQEDQSRPECCPVCGGDCGSANPPVDPMSCPMRRNAQ